VPFATFHRAALSTNARRFTSSHAPRIVLALLPFASWGTSSCLPPRFVVITSCTPPVSSLLHRVMTRMATSRHFVATQQFGRFRSKADIQRAALTEPDLSDASSGRA
jgi:hypothetical protein